MKTTRRTFIKQSGAAIASTALLSQIPLDLMAYSTIGDNLSFGFQIWTINRKLQEDFAGTLKEMKEMGYSEVEMCSPLGYGFTSLNEMKGSEMRTIVEDIGLKCTSSHFTLAELRENLENRIEWAHALGMKQMVLSMFTMNRSTPMDEWRKYATELNGIAEKTKTAGIQMGFHNHHFEFRKIDDVLIYDVLLEEFDPELVKLQFQVAVVDQGYHAADYFRKHPGRFISAHLTDWSAESEENVPVGQGIVKWDDFFEAAKIGGVQNYYVEQDPAMFKESAEYLQSV